jgi:hypothetical protein
VIGGQLPHRRRFALLVTLTVVLVAGGIAAAVIELPHGGMKLDQGPVSPPPPGQYKSEQAQRSRTLSTAERHQLLSSIVLFVTTAVERKHPERSWPVVDRTLREGLTKEQWRSGNIPVVPFPAESVGPLNVTSVVGKEALVEMVLIPDPSSHLVKKTFIMQLEEHSAKPPRWAVSSWMPAGISYSQPPQQHVSREAIDHALRSDTLSPLWIIVPMGILIGGVLLLPAGVFARDAYRARRAEAEARSARS